MTRIPRAGSVVRRLRLPPAWTVLLAFAGDAALAGWRVASHGPPTHATFFLRSLLWPGGGVLVAVYIFAWLGWALDID